MWKNIKSKMSMNLGLWIFGAVFAAIASLWGYSENTYQRHNDTMQALKYETNERIHQIQLDAAEIKASLKKMEKQ